MGIFRQHVANENVGVLSKIRKSADARHDVNTRSIATGQTPLMLSKSPEITKILLESGADPNLQNREGSTARVAQRSLF